MTTLSNQIAHISSEPTTAMPGHFDMEAVLPELSSPQERFDHGFKRGYLAGYAEGARQAQAERAADLATQKATWAATLARAGALVGQLASATDEYIDRFNARDSALTEQLIAAAFELAEAVVGCELRTRPEQAVDIARSLLANLPAGPAVVRVNPGDEELMPRSGQHPGRQPLRRKSGGRSQRRPGRVHRHFGGEDRRRPHRRGPGSRRRRLPLAADGDGGGRRSQQL